MEYLEETLSKAKVVNIVKNPRASNTKDVTRADCQAQVLHTT